MLNSTTKKNIAKKVIALDNDECLGFFPLASAMYTLFVCYIAQTTGISPDKCAEIFRDVMVKYYLPNGGARPGTKELLQKIHLYKISGYIDSVVMFTSSTNNNDWVFFLKDCLEEYAGVPVYDLVLHRQNTKAKVATDGATVKCLNTVRDKLGFGSNTEVIIVDDKPDNIVGPGIRIPVKPYTHIVSSSILSDMIKEAFDKLGDVYKNITCKKHSPDKLIGMVENIILNSPDGMKIEIKKNLSLGRPNNQMNDTDLITKSVEMFRKHFN